MEFKIESFFNPHLSIGSRRIDAVISARCVSSENNESAPSVENMGKAICLVIDVSGSMDGDKIRAAKHAARRCVDMLEAATMFCVIAFNESAEVVVPMGLADAQRKNGAHKAIQNLSANGGTRLSTAVNAARGEFEKVSGMINAAMLLTDGQNDREDARALNKAIEKSQGQFQCDCRGLGADWKPDELRLISNGLDGSADACVNPDSLESDFKKFLTRSMSKVASDARLKIWTPKVAKIIGIKQMSPEIVELGAKGRKLDEKTTEFSLGSWGNETRDYHVAIELPAGAADDEMIACRASITILQNGQEVVFNAPNVVATWSQDTSLTARINAQVAHYTGQEELADSIREGLAALANRQSDEATRLLGNAAKIAHSSGNDEVTARLRKVVDIVDPDQGTVRLKSGVGKAETLELDMGGTRTVRRRVGIKPTDGAGT